MQRPLSRGQRDGHDRGIEHHHQLGDDDDTEDGPAFRVGSDLSWTDRHRIDWSFCQLVPTRECDDRPNSGEPPSPDAGDFSSAQTPAKLRSRLQILEFAWLSQVSWLQAGRV